MSIATRPGCQVDFNDIGIGKVSERVDFLDNIDIEALPTGGWGYFYAPAQIRYQRNFGLPVYGMTGRFVSTWADFGGLKLPQQLDVELASLVANAARCDVGDQMPPNGQLDAAVYHVLGKSFGRIKKLEPYLDESAPVTEAALMIPVVALERLEQPYIFGLVKLMIELNLQFDVVETGQEWERYNLVVIPDELMPDSKTVERLHQYIGKGGAVIVCHNGGLQAETKQSWLERYGMKFDGNHRLNRLTLLPGMVLSKICLVMSMLFTMALRNGRCNHLRSRWHSLANRFFSEVQSIIPVINNRRSTMLQNIQFGDKR